MLAIYCRISGKKTEGRDVSIEVQRDTGIKFANEKGYQYKLYVDKGISGAKTEIEERPQFANLIADIKRGIITKVFAYDQSRIVRQAKIWHLFVYELEKKRCQYFENGKLIDLNDTNTKFYTGLLALVDQLYTETTSIKVKAANKANAKKGKGHGITLYGYYKDENGYLKINGDEAKIVKNIFSMSASGIGTYTIANNLNNLGIKPKSSQFKGRYLKKKDNYTNRETLIKRDEIKWSGTTIYGMLRNSSYKGIRKYGNEVIEISPIITEELWDKVNNNLKNIKSGKKSSYNYLLNGLIFCGECNSELRGKIKKERNKTYSCAGKRKKKNCKKSRGINIVKLDSFILKHLFYTKELQNHLSNLNLKKGKNDKLESDINNKKELIKKEQKVFHHLEKLMADPELYDTNLKIQYLDSKKKILVLEKDLKDLKFKLNQSDSIRSQKRIDKIFGKYDVNLNFDEIKKLVHQLIDKIIIHHLKDVKKIMIEIKYAGFDEKSTFISTDLKLSSFDNIYHIENSSFNESDILNYYNLIYPKFKSRYKTKNEIIDVVKNNNRWYNKLDGLTYEEIIMEITRGEIKYKSKKNVLSPSITLGDDELYNFNIIT